MKLSKALLGAILLGVAVQATATSCTKKDKDLIKPQPQTEAQAVTSEQPSSQNPDPNCCPACGMG